VAMKITIVGCGPGSPEYLTRAATRAIQRADVLVGSQRLLDLFPDEEAELLPIGADINSALELIATHWDHKSVAVLVSGDPGLFSLTKRIIERFGREACEVVPGVSSVQVAFARLGLDWADARIISAHKENPESALVESLKHEDKLAVFAGRKEAMDWIADLAGRLAQDRRIFVFENLTLDDEKVHEVSAEQLSRIEVGSRTIVLIINSAMLK
jgi:cobalt-precorrin-7 (C5)-methyltransferase